MSAKSDNMSHNKPYNLNAFSSRESLAAQLLSDVAEQLQASIDDKGYACCAVSGGSTPELLFELLGNSNIDWQRVLFTLVDERLVDEQHQLSNAAFFKRCLAKSNSDVSAQLRFLPLFYSAEGDSVEGSSAGPAFDHETSLVKMIENNWLEFTNEFGVSDRQDALKFDVAILGMGGDGHTASFFPDAGNIADLLDPDADSNLLFCSSPSTQVKRVTWSMPMLLDSQFLCLHIHGADKLQVLQQACNSNEAPLPIAALVDYYLEFRKQPLPCYYAV